MKISLEEWLTLNCYSNTQEVLEALSVDDTTCPALCDEECVVEPDGTCPHGAPSILLALGLI